MGSINIIHGNITTSQTDAIVNAAKPSLAGGSGVDGAIHRAAGPQLLDECLQIPLTNGVRCPTGQAKITSAGNLPSRYVIHTVGPIYSKESAPDTLLGLAYKNSIELALNYGCKSIAFPAISCGKYGYPVAKAAQIAINSCESFRTKDIEILFYLIDLEVERYFSKALRSKGKT